MVGGVFAAGLCAAVLAVASLRHLFDAVVNFFRHNLRIRLNSSMFRCLLKLGDLLYTHAQSQSESLLKIRSHHAN